MDKDIESCVASEWRVERERAEGTNEGRDRRQERECVCVCACVICLNAHLFTRSEEDRRAIERKVVKRGKEEALGRAWSPKKE